MNFKKRIFNRLTSALFILSLSSPGFAAILTVSADSNDADYSSIQAAIDNADAGDTIQVAAGSYDEALTLSQSITLLGANAGINPNTESRTDESVLTGAGSIRLIASAANVIIDGFAFTATDGALAYEHGAILMPPREDGGTVGGAPFNHFENISIRNNWFHDLSARPVLKDCFATFDGLYILNNRIENVTDDHSGIKIQSRCTAGDPSTDLEISGNVIDGTGYAGIIVDSVVGVTIADNSINAAPVHGINFAASHAGSGNVTISGNTISEAAKPDGSGALRIKGGSYSGSLRILDNILRNSRAGLVVESGVNVAGDFEVRSNQFSDNVASGVLNDSSFVLDARKNWWEDESGPSGAGEGNGDAVDSMVNFDAWCLQADCQTHAEVPHLAVCDSCAFTSPQQAIDAAFEGDTIALAPGTYSEALIIDKDDVTLLGEPGTVLEIGHLATAITIAADGVTIEGLEIVGPVDEPHTSFDWDDPDHLTSYGILVQQGYSAFIRNNNIRNLRTAISIFPDSTQTVISGNHIDNTKGSILLRSDVADISANTIGEFGNEWDIVLLNSLYDPDDPDYTPASLTLLPGQDDQAAYGAAVMALSDDNGGMSVLDRRFGSGNRSHAFIAEGANPGPDDDFGIGNGLGNERQPYGAIAHGITAVVEGGLVMPGPGDYEENVRIARPLDLVAANGAVLTGRIDIEADDVTVSGLELTNPDAGYGIVVDSVIGVMLLDNHLHDIGTTLTGTTPNSATAQAIYLVGQTDGARISGNVIANIGSAASNSSNKGIFIGDSPAAPATGIIIENNTISGITGGRGGYGVLVNHAVTGLTIDGNSLNNISGSWVHAIGLEANTPGAVVHDNTIAALNAEGEDEAGIFFESNDASASVQVNENRFAATLAYGVARHPDQSGTVNATHNYWGTAAGPASGAKASSGVTFNPWYTSTVFAPSTLSNFVPPEPEPEPDPVPPDVSEVEEEVNDLVDVIEVPEEDGEPVSEEVISTVGAAAEATTGLADSLAANIETVDEDAAIQALDTIGKVVDVSGKTAANTVANGNSAGASASGSSGGKALNNFSKVLGALDGKVNKGTGAAPLAEAQKSIVQQVAVKAVASAVNIVKAAGESPQKAAVMQDLGKIVSSSLNLGVSLTEEQTDSLLEAADEAATNEEDPEALLETSVPIKPRNTALISRDVLEEALADTGVSSEELDIFLTELAEAINPADIDIGGVNGEDALREGFASGIGSGQGDVSFDPETGTMFFTIGAAGDTGTEGLRSAQALSLPARTIPARVISSNVVASTFPEGIRLRGNGAAVITRNRIASIVVPASYDPVNFYVDLRALGRVSVDEQGNVTIAGIDSFLSATFDFRGTGAGDGQFEVTTLKFPAGADEASVDYYFTVVYRDGTTQKLQPFVHENDLVPSVRSRGLTIQVNRNNGVITVNKRRYRPSYLVETVTTEEARAFWQARKDEYGLAYRAMHANDDGVVDIEVISENGVQLVYGIGP